jgi:preprotein translocase subunit SecB
MENITISSFKFDGFKITKSYFEMNEIVEGNLTFTIGFAPKGLINEKTSTFKLELVVNIEDEDKKFKANITAVASYTYDSNIQAENLDKFFYINAPAILFPYIRAYISSLTTLSGLNPITLPTLNLSNLGEELKKNTVIEK